MKKARSRSDRNAVRRLDRSHLWGSWNAAASIPELLRLESSIASEVIALASGWSGARPIQRKRRSLSRMLLRGAMSVAENPALSSMEPQRSFELARTP